MSRTSAAIHDPDSWFRSESRSPLMQLFARSRVRDRAVCLPRFPRARRVEGAGIVGDLRLHPHVRSLSLDLPRDVWVWLPPGYDEAANAAVRYPVLYAQDGNNLFDSRTAFMGRDWKLTETLDRMIRAGHIPPLIVVGVGNTRARVDEYTWHVGATHGHRCGGRAPRYVSFLAEELKPLIDRHYRTLKGSEHTSVMGSSLGALASLYAAIHRGESFGNVAVISPSIWWANAAVLEDVRELPTSTRVWLCMGGEEGEDHRHHLMNARRLRRRLELRGFTIGQQMAYFEDQSGRHEEAAWAERMPMVLRFLTGREVEAVEGVHRDNKEPSGSSRP